MGASPSRNEDASLNLAVPKHSTIIGRRILDPGTTRCSNCDSLFIPLIRKKHYCRRCGSIICEECSTMRHYKQRDGGWLFRICRKCNAQPFILDVLIPGERPWRLIMEFAGDLSQHRVLQVCRRSQLSYHLPYKWGTWEELFTEQQFLAKGANGAVYRTMFRQNVAREFDTPAAQGPIAVKVIQKNSIYSLRKWSHIQRELDTLKLCRHPHVIELIGVFQSPDAVFIILEFAQGGDLFDWLVARRKPKEAEVRSIAVQLLGTIFLMHERFGVVHRDIKPENILLKSRCRGSEEPHLKFADFGFARRYAVKPNSVFNQMASAAGVNSNTTTSAGGAQSALLAAVASGGVRINNNNNNNNNYNNSGGGYNDHSSYNQGYGGGSFVGSLGAGGGDSFDPSHLLMNATPCGTLGFAPPEVIQAYNARKADPTTHSAAPSTPIDTMKKMDIFALGITLAILLTGQEPFPVNSSRAHVESVQRGVNFNTRPWQYVSVAAKSLIKRMLAGRVEDRPHALECLRAEWFEGTSANSYIQQHPSARVPPPQQMLETEEDVRTFQKSVRSLRNRPDMVYVHNKDGTGVSMSSKTAAKIKEEEHIAAEENLTEAEDGIKISSSPNLNNNNNNNSKNSNKGPTAGAPPAASSSSSQQHQPKQQTIGDIMNKKNMSSETTEELQTPPHQINN